MVKCVYTQQSAFLFTNSPVLELKLLPNDLLHWVEQFDGIWKLVNVDELVLIAAFLQELFEPIVMVGVQLEHGLDALLTKMIGTPKIYIRKHILQMGD